MKLMSQKSSQSGVIHIPAILIIVLAVGLLVSANVNVSQEFPDDEQVQGVLAERAGSNESRGSQPEAVKLKQEIRTSDEKVKTELKEDGTSRGLNQASTKTKFQQRGNELLIKTKIESEEDEATEAGEDEATGSADEGELVQELRAISKFPLRIDTATNQLIMTKNGVERVLTVLPAKAVQNMLRAHLKKGLGPKFFQGATASAQPSATPSGEPTSTPSASPSEEPVATESAELTILEDQIALEEIDGQIVYKIPAKKHLKILGFLPIDTDLTGFVSAQTGSLLKEQESLLSRILDLLSP